MLQRAQTRGRARFDLLPAIDLRGGRVVRLFQGDFERETIYAGDPAEAVAGFLDAGARWIHVVDLEGARDGAPRQGEAVAAVLSAAGGGVRCEVAGGLRDEASVAAVLGLGAARAVVGTVALEDPELVGRLVALHGADRIAVALDLRGGLAVGAAWRPGGSGTPAMDVLAECSSRGVRTFIVTAIERDGSLTGPDLGSLRRMVRQGRGDIVASGGISSLADIEAVRSIGCTGAVVGRAIYEGRLDLAEAVRRFDAG